MFRFASKLSNFLTMVPVLFVQNNAGKLDLPDDQDLLVSLRIPISSSTTQSIFVHNFRSTDDKYTEI